MKIVFLSNYYTHHQAPFCEVMYEHLGSDFCFIQTTEMSKSRRKLGWEMDNIPSFVKKNYGDPLAVAECTALIENADVIITGSAPNYLIANHINRGKLVLRYSERLFKKGLELWKWPYRLIKFHKDNPKNANIYMLCASAFTSADYSKLGLFKNRCYKWGYFPALKRYSSIDQIIQSKQPASLLWVARFIDWKHPELPVLVAKRLKEENYSFVMHLIGGGECEEKIQNMIRELGLEDCVQLLGVMKPEQVREHMEKSQIYLFTSDRNEGWGAVLNESMNSACAVVASDAIGAVPYLLKNGENGFIYPDGNFDELYANVKQLLDSPGTAALLGKKAYEAMITEWNAEVAAERLLNLISDLQKGTGSSRYLDGPCSKA